MLSNFEYDKLIHTLKRSAKVMSFLKSEISTDRGISLLGLLVDEFDDMAKDLEQFKESNKG